MAYMLGQAPRAAGKSKLKYQGSGGGAVMVALPPSQLVRAP
jgi:hypothetical protein